MTDLQNYPYPTSAFDLGDPVYVTGVKRGGKITGIQERQRGWYYSVAGIGSDQWWKESDLTSACPNCYMPWQGLESCSNCGLSAADIC